MNAQVQAIRTKVLEIKGEYEDIAIDQHPGRGFVHANYVVDDLEQLLSLIDSLQQEQHCEGYDEAYLNEKIAKASKTWEGVDVDKYMAEMRGYEQPCEDLEAEIGKVFFSRRFEDEHGRLSIQLSLEEFSDIAEHFYELGKQSKEPVNEDLEKYASRAGFDYVDDIEQKYPGHRWNDHDVEYAYRDGIIAGAEWQKSQMIRDCSVQASYEAEIEKAEERGYNLCKE